LTADCKRIVLEFERYHSMIALLAVISKTADQNGFGLHDPPPQYLAETEIMSGDR
jgi:hypothetical protein